MKEEALKLADKLTGLNSCEPVVIKACEDMIRKLVAHIEELENPILQAISRAFDEPQK